MSHIAYGRALYYPHITFNSDEWLKTAALFYKGLNRIVPDKYDERSDNDTVRRLIDEADFVRDIDPWLQAEDIADEFLKFAEDELADHERRQIMVKRLQTAIPYTQTFSVHMYKMGEILQRELPKLGLAVKSEGDRSDWYEFEPVTGALYMTCLANSLAQRDEVPVVTDNPLFQPFINGMQLERFKADNDHAESLASIVIQSVVPVGIENIPIKKIIKFRQKYEDERHQFYNELNSLVKDIEKVDRTDLIHDCLEAKKHNIDIAVHNLENSLRGVNIATTTAMLGLSVPTIATGQGWEMTTIGFVTAAVAKIMFQKNEYKIKKSSPYSYVLSLKKDLGTESFIKEMIGGKLVI